MQPWFNARKAAQIAAFFALKENGSVFVLKVMKLIYLSEREFLRKYDTTLLGDNLVSMDWGPVNSLTLSCINGEAGQQQTDWDSFISDRENHRIALTHPGLRFDDLDELSEADLEVLEQIWERFGGMDRFELSEWTHKNCPEWEDPSGSAFPIPYKRVFHFLGKPDADYLEKKIKAERQLLSAFNN